MVLLPVVGLPASIVSFPLPLISQLSFCELYPSSEFSN